MPNNAQVMSFTAPTVVSSGQVFNALLTVKNTGDVVWTRAANHRLGSQNPQDNNLFGPGRWQMPNDLILGSGLGQLTFDLQLTAPVAGSYNLAFQMVQDGVEWFGGVANQPISVSATPPVNSQFPAPGSNPNDLLWCEALDTGIVPIQAPGGNELVLTWTNTTNRTVHLTAGQLTSKVKSASSCEVSAKVTRTSDGALLASSLLAYTTTGVENGTINTTTYTPGVFVIAPGDGFTIKYICKCPSNIPATVRHVFGAWALPGA